MPRIITEGPARRLEAARHNIYLAENLDATVVGIAMQYQGRTDYDNIWRELRSAIFEAVAIQGMGVFETLKAVAKQVLYELRSR